MKKYFYSNGTEKEGPLTLEELKKKKEIKPKSLIWFEGLDDWTLAENIEELREVFEEIPPPLETEKSSKIKTENPNSENQNSANTQFAKKQGMFANPYSFNGRISRTEYGISFTLIFILITYVNTIVQSGESSAIGLAYIPLYWVFWAQGAKRCHDLGKNGWWQIIPFYVLWMIFQKGQPSINKYGNPKN